MMPYNSSTINLQSGDKLILFTDGVSEAMNPQSEEFSEERLEKLAIETSEINSSETITSIRQSVDRFVNGAPQSDDLTMMVIKVK
jgi:sigma-B regulation protein RsbU (phosphoserine phosphatase)